MATPRYQLVHPTVPMFYHIVSRCVRRAFLCGYDRKTKRKFHHRKAWIEQRLYQLAQYFAVEVHAYAILDNHFHLVVYYHPTAANEWSDQEVAQRWLNVCPPKGTDGQVDESLKTPQIEALLNDPQRLAQVRNNLGSLSCFMKLLKQPIARRANREDDRSGHFFEQRFYSGVLLDDDSVLAGMAYVDLNPIRARIANTIEQAKGTSIQARLRKNSSQNIEAYLAPLVSGLKEPTVLPTTLRAYKARLAEAKAVIRPGVRSDKFSRWQRQVMCIQRRQRAYGHSQPLKAWIDARGWQHREKPLP